MFEMIHFTGNDHEIHRTYPNYDEAINEYNRMRVNGLIYENVVIVDLSTGEIAYDHLDS
jgi:flagellum-specific peptidoglycan hydrolase FlgJ